MKTIHSNAYDLVNNLGELKVQNLKLDPTSGIYRTPYKELSLRTTENASANLKMYDADDVLS
jgi:hypothetical protein